MPDGPPSGFFQVKNWKKFQHYKKRNPPWIRLYNELLDDYNFNRLPDASKWHAVGIWLLASRFDNRIPADPIWVQQRIGAREPVDLSVLVSAGFIEGYEGDSEALAERTQDAKPEGEAETEGEAGTEGEAEKDANASLENAAPVAEMHELFNEIHGGRPPLPTLTPGRREKYRALWDEHLSKLDDWPTMWRSLLLAITESDHHMSNRDYQMPESFLGNAEKRDRWMLKAAERMDGQPNLSKADRALLKRRRELDEIDFAGEVAA